MMIVILFPSASAIAHEKKNVMSNCQCICKHFQRRKTLDVLLIINVLIIFIEY